MISRLHESMSNSFLLLSNFRRTILSYITFDFLALYFSDQPILLLFFLDFYFLNAFHVALFDILLPFDQRTLQQI